MKNKIMLIGLISLLLVGGCSNSPKSKNASDDLVTFSEGEKKSIKVDELYEILKEKYGFEELITLVDTYIYESEFKDYKSTAKDKADSTVKGIKTNYESDEEFLNAIIQNTNYNSVEEYTNAMYLSYMQENAIIEYSKSLVKDDEIQKYYDEDFKENVDAYHILITPNVKSDASDKDKEEAEKKAKDSAKKIIDEINKSSNKLETFKKLAKEKSEDEATKNDGGSLGEVNEFTMGQSYINVVNELYNIKDGEVSSKVIESSLGYHVVFKNKTLEKEKLDNVKEDIIEKLSQEYIAADTNFQMTAIKHYHEKYGVDVKDSYLEKEYKTYLNRIVIS